MSFTLTWPEVVKLDAVLHCVLVPIQTAILADVEAQLNESRLGSYRYQLCCKYLAAHLATVFLSEDAQGPSGPLTSESVGSVSRSYASIGGATLDNASLASTRHGLEYLRLIKTSAARFVL
jgi:hypothetical protein